MSSKPKTTNIRFNLDDPDQRKAWEYLQTMDKQVFKSYSHAVCLALLDYFDRYYKQQDDPFFETREREDRFAQQIVNAVSETLKQTLPAFIAGCIAGAGAVMPASTPAAQASIPAESNAPEQSAESVSADIDWGFLGLDD